MASRRPCTLPSDPEFLIALISELGDESESEDEFDGWLDEHDGPRVVRNCDSVCPDSSPVVQDQHSLSLDSLADNGLLSTESPLELSPSHSPRHAQSSSSPMQLASPSLSPMQTGPGPATQPTSSTSTTQESPPLSQPFTARPGVIVDMDSNDPIDFFRLLFDERVMELIFSETCRYARQYLQREKEHLDTHPNARAHEWTKTTLTHKEIEAFLALLIAMGICGFPSLRSYWSKSWPFASNNFSSVMSSRRFELILKFLHLNDSQAQPQRGEPGYDKLYKVRPFLDLLLENFQSSYQPYQHISIDESMISYKGRLSFIQYLPKKPHKWGLKAWVLADSRNGYTWGWQLYTGKEDNTVTHGLSHRVVMQLAHDPRLEQKGYIIYTDNFYSSPALFKALTEKGFGACGTARRDRKGIPKAVSTSKLRKGEVCSSYDDGVLSLKWQDKREVFMLSTFHDDTMVDKARRSRSAQSGVETIQKPHVVEEYNKFMGGVDRSDQMILYYGFAHKSVKWWKRVFFHMLDLALVNAHILSLESGNKHTQLEFRLAVSKGLLEGFESQRGHRTFRAPELPLRLTEARPFLEPTPKGTRPDCRVCSNRAAGERHQTGYRCKGCKTPLCPYPCMERYHTLKDYKKKY